MDNTTSIQPFIVTTSSTVTSFTVSCRSLDLFNSASFIVDSYDVNKIFISRQLLSITPEQYINWKNDDKYIINLMATMCGYTPNTPDISSIIPRETQNEP